MVYTFFEIPADRRSVVELENRQSVPGDLFIYRQLERNIVTSVLVGEKLTMII